MFTAYTWQDWQAEGMDRPEADGILKAKAVDRIIKKYKGSSDFLYALECNEYFAGSNPVVLAKKILKGQTVEYEVETPDGKTAKKMSTKVKEIIGNRIPNNLFSHFVIQQNQYLLGNGVTLTDQEQKQRLGYGFDKVLQQIGERALIHGVGYGFWNYDHLEPLDVAQDKLTGFVALLDENTSAPMVGIQFWQLATNKPLNARLFEPDGVTVYRANDKGMLVVADEKRAYQKTVISDVGGAYAERGENYGSLPIIPLYANGSKASELTESIKAKIDLYDVILSDFGDNLQRTNDVYWVLNNFGGNTKDIANMMRMIDDLRVVANTSDGMSSSTAEPHTLEVPYNARQVALELLKKAMYDDYMALDMTEITGGSLTNVAIKAAMTNLNLKADRYEWQCFEFVQKVLSLLGIKTEEIRFKRQEIVNETEVVSNIATMRQDIDQRTALKLNPYINQEEIEDIIKHRDTEGMTGVASEQSLQDLIDQE